MNGKYLAKKEKKKMHILNYDGCYERMLCCPGSRKELLSALRGSTECYASSVVLVPLDSYIVDTTKGLAFLFFLSLFLG